MILWVDITSLNCLNTNQHPLLHSGKCNQKVWVKRIREKESLCESIEVLRKWCKISLSLDCELEGNNILSKTDKKPLLCNKGKTSQVLFFGSRMIIISQSKWYLFFVRPLFYAQLFHMIVPMSSVIRGFKIYTFFSLDNFCLGEIFICFLTHTPCIVLLYIVFTTQYVSYV